MAENIENKTETQQEIPGISDFVFRISGGEMIKLREGDDDKMIGFMIDCAPFLQRNSTYMQATANQTGTRARQAIQYKAVPRKDPSAYVKFYADAMKLNPSDFSSRTSDKRELLMTYFPTKFGDDGSQPISGYSPQKLGSLFYQMMQSAARSSPKR